MPWKPADADRHTKLADKHWKQVIWAHVANDALKDTGNEARAIKEANAVIKRLSEG